LDLSNPVSVDFAGDGFDAGLRAGLDRFRSLATAYGLLIHESSAGAALLRALSYYRLGDGVLCVPFGEARALELVMVVVPATVLLPAGDVLRNDQVSRDGDPWPGCGLGQDRKKGYG